MAYITKNTSINEVDTRTFVRYNAFIDNSSVTIESYFQGQGKGVSIRSASPVTAKSCYLALRRELFDSGYRGKNNGI